MSGPVTGRDDALILFPDRPQNFNEEAAAAASHVNDADFAKPLHERFGRRVILTFFGDQFDDLADQRSE